MQHAQGVLLFLVRFNNSAQVEIYGVTRSFTSRPFLCTLGQLYSLAVFRSLLLPSFWSQNQKLEGENSLAMKLTLIQ